MHVKKAPERSASTKFSPSAISKFPVTCFQFPHKTGIHLYLTFPFQNHFARLPVDSITHAILIANEHPHCLIRISRQCFFSNKILPKARPPKRWRIEPCAWKFNIFPLSTCNLLIYYYIPKLTTSPSINTNSFSGNNAYVAICVTLSSSSFIIFNK